MIFKRHILKELAKYQANIQTDNITNLNDDVISSIDWKNVDKWKQYSEEEILSNSSVNNFSEFDITNAKLDEFNEWKTYKFYDTVDNCSRKSRDLRWFFFSEKYINGELNVKDRLVAKGLQEDGSDILSDSPTFGKESMRPILNIIASSKWFSWYIV